MYTINYNTGAGNQTANKLEDAKIIADRDCQCTGADITIEKDGEVVSRRKWWSVEFDAQNDESKDPIMFGTFGYYADWDY